MSTSDFTETIRQLKLDLAKGTPVCLRINAAGSQLIRPTPRPQVPSPANGTFDHPKYDSIRATLRQLELEQASTFPAPFSNFFNPIYHASRRSPAPGLVSPPPRPTTYRDGNGTKVFDPFLHLDLRSEDRRHASRHHRLTTIASCDAAAEGRRRLATRHPDGEGNLHAVSAYWQLDRAGKRAYLTRRLYFSRVYAEETRLNNQLYDMPSSHPRRSSIKAAFIVVEADSRAYRRALPKFDYDRRRTDQQVSSHQQFRLTAKAVVLAAVSEAQRRLARQPAPSSPMRQHLYLIQHYAGVFRPGMDAATCFYDSQLPRSTDRSRHTTEHRRLELEDSAPEPCRYRRHLTGHGRTWQPRSAFSQPPARPLKRQRSRPSMDDAPPLAATPATPPDLPALPASATAPTSKADYPESDVASAASTVDIVAALLTLLRFVSGTLTPARRRFTRSERCTMETRLPVPSAATERQWPQTAPTLGRWSCAPRNGRKARSSLQLHHGSTDGTGTRPSFEPR